MFSSFARPFSDEGERSKFLSSTMVGPRFSQSMDVRKILYTGTSGVASVAFRWARSTVDCESWTEGDTQKGRSREGRSPWGSHSDLDQEGEGGRSPFSLACVNRGCQGLAR